MLLREGALVNTGEKERKEEMREERYCYIKKMEFKCLNIYVREHYNRVRTKENKMLFIKQMILREIIGKELKKNNNLVFNNQLLESLFLEVRFQNREARMKQAVQPNWNNKNVRTLVMEKMYEDNITKFKQCIVLHSLLYYKNEGKIKEELEKCKRLMDRVEEEQTEEAKNLLFFNICVLTNESEFQIIINESEFQTVLGSANDCYNQIVRLQKLNLLTENEIDRRTQEDFFTVLLREFDQFFVVDQAGQRHFPLKSFNDAITCLSQKIAMLEQANAGPNERSWWEVRKILNGLLNDYKDSELIETESVNNVQGLLDRVGDELKELEEFCDGVLPIEDKETFYNGQVKHGKGFIKEILQTINANPVVPVVGRHITVISIEETSLSEQAFFIRA